VGSWPSQLGVAVFVNVLAQFRAAAMGLVLSILLVNDGRSS